MKAGLHQALSDRGVVIGTWSIVANATLVEIACRAGLDFVLLDMEHGAYDLGSLEHSIRAAEGAGASPLVRVPNIDGPLIQRVLDLGAHGIVVPQIRSASDAAVAVAATRFAPQGTRGYNPFTRAADYAAPASAGAGKLAPGFPLVAIIVENEDAVAALPEICAVDGVEVIYLGVYDMAIALGCGGNVQHPRVRSFAEDAARTVAAAGKVLGVMARTAEAMDDAAALGARMLVLGVDANVVYEAFRAPVEHLRARGSHSEA